MSERTSLLQNSNNQPEYYTILQQQLRPSLPFYHVNYTKFPTKQRTLFTIISIILAALAVYLYNLYTHKDLVDQLALSIENLSTCASCRALLIPLISIAHLGDQKLLSTLVAFCTGLGIQDPDVCRGALGAQAPILAHSLRSMSLNGPAATLFCAKTFGLCEDPPVRDWHHIFPLSQQLQPNLSATQRSPNNIHPHSPSASQSKTKPETLKVIHISDLHIDREYTVSHIFIDLSQRKKKYTNMFRLTCWKRLEQMRIALATYAVDSTNLPTYPTKLSSLQDRMATTTVIPPYPSTSAC